MLGAINQGPCFAGPKYNILQVVAAFPLDVNFTSKSQAVRNAIQEDTHPLAKLSRLVLTTELTTCKDGKSFVNQLNRTLKRACLELEEGSDDEAEDDRPMAKRTRGVRQPV